ncbi:MAG: hypothetical protein IPM69_16405 [Ignavibacteria bacterium]|nr:hypothetical protein [Ignavibacteria bacterium]
MNQLLLLIVILLFIQLSPTYSQSSPSTWAKSIGGELYDETSCIATDRQGNVFTAGNFQSISVVAEQIRLTNTGKSGSDFFISKYSSAGELLWTKSFGGTLADNLHSIAVDYIGNILVIGEFYSPKIMLGTIELINSGKSGSPEIFLAKLTTDGTILWAKSAKGNGFDEGRAITTDSIGNIICTGWYQSPTLSFDKITLKNNGLRDVYVAKYSPLGEVMWAQGLGAESSESGSAIATDSAGNIVVAGDFRSPKLTIGIAILPNSSKDNSDAFVAKLDAKGKFLWAKSMGGNLGDAATCLTIDHQGNVIVGGFFASSVLRFKSITFANQGNYDVFIVKYNPSGTFLWAKSYGGDELDNINSISSDSEGNIYCFGGFGSHKITFGDISLIGTQAASYVHNDIYLAKYTSTGGVELARKLGGGIFDDASGITLDFTNSICISGRFNSPFVEIDGNKVTTKGEHDGFVAKMLNQAPKK